MFLQDEIYPKEFQMKPQKRIFHRPQLKSSKNFLSQNLGDLLDTGLLSSFDAKLKTAHQSLASIDL